MDIKDTPEFLQAIREQIIGGVAKCLIDLEIYVDMAEAYKLMPQENIDICRKKIKNPFKD